MSFDEVVYRPAFGRVLAVVTVVVSAIGVVALLWVDAAAGIRYVWPIILVAALAWALFWRPSLHVEQHGVTVENVLRTYFVPWPAIEDVDTRYSLTLYTVNGRISVWAAPAPGRHRMMGLAQKDFDGVGDSARSELGGLRPADALSLPSGNLAQLIRGHWEQLRDAGAFARGVDPESSTVTWHKATITVLAALVLATLAGLVL